MKKYTIKFYVDDGICRSSCAAQLEGLCSVLDDHYLERHLSRFNSELGQAVSSGSGFEVGFNSSFMQYDGKDHVKLLDSYGVNPYCIIGIETLMSVFQKWSEWVLTKHKSQAVEHIQIDSSLIRNESRGGL